MHEYATKYISLLRFAGALVPDEAEKARRFQSGLRDNIRGRVALQRLEDYTKVLDVATIAEQEIELTRQHQQGKRPGEGSSRGQGSFKRANTRSGSGMSSSGQGPSTPSGGRL